MGKADYKKRKLKDPEQDTLLEYKEICDANRNGKKEGFQVTEQHSRWCKKMLARNYRRKNKNVEIEEDE